MKTLLIHRDKIPSLFTVRSSYYQPPGASGPNTYYNVKPNEEFEGWLTSHGLVNDEDVTYDIFYDEGPKWVAVTFHDTNFAVQFKLSFL